MKSGKYEIDERRTRELNLPELLVVKGKGDRNHFFCILVPSKARPGCPRCGNRAVRNQGNMHRDYLDVIRRGKDAALVTVSLEFRKSKCEAPASTILISLSPALMPERHEGWITLLCAWSFEEAAPMRKWQRSLKVS